MVIFEVRLKTMFEAIVNGRSRKPILDGLLEVELDEGGQFDLRKRLIQSVLLSFKINPKIMVPIGPRY